MDKCIKTLHAGISTESPPSQNLTETQLESMSSIHSSVSEMQILANMLLSAVSLNQFIFFPKLPIELRLKIWREALPGPRIIEAYYDYHESSDGDISNGVIRTNQPPPVLLSVCFESREEALRQYISICNPEDFREVNYCHVLLDPCKDTLFIPYANSNLSDHYLQACLVWGDFYSEVALEKIRYLAIDTDVWDQYTQGHVECISKFRNLKRLTLIDHEGGWLCYENHDSWRMKETDIKFVKLARAYNLSALFSEREKEVRALFQKVKETFPKWNEPTIHFKTIARGDKRCCYRAGRDDN